jgi:hypothetical protein
MAHRDPMLCHKCAVRWHIFGTCAAYEGLKYEFLTLHGTCAICVLLMAHTCAMLKNVKNLILLNLYLVSS